MIIERECPDCHEMAKYSFGEIVIFERLGWYESQHCTNCGYTIEGDDSGVLPPDLRQLELKQNGLWQLTIDGSPSIKILKIVRELLDLSLQDVRDIIRRGEGVLAEGTQMEMKFIQSRLPAIVDSVKIYRLE